MIKIYKVARGLVNIQIVLSLLFTCQPLLTIVLRKPGMGRAQKNLTTVCIEKIMYNWEKYVLSKVVNQAEQMLVKYMHPGQQDILVASLSLVCFSRHNSLFFSSLLHWLPYRVLRTEIFTKDLSLISRKENHFCNYFSDSLAWCLFSIPSKKSSIFSFCCLSNVEHEATFSILQLI